MVRPLKSWISPWKIFRRFEMVGKRVTFDDETWIRDLSRAKGVVSRRSDRLGRLLPLTVARQKPRATAPHGTVA